MKMAVVLLMVGLPTVWASNFSDNFENGIGSGWTTNSGFSSVTAAQANGGFAPITGSYLAEGYNSASTGVSLSKTLDATSSGILSLYAGHNYTSDCPSVYYVKLCGSEGDTFATYYYNRWNNSLYLSIRVNGSDVYNQPQGSLNGTNHWYKLSLTVNSGGVTGVASYADGSSSVTTTYSTTGFSKAASFKLGEGSSMFCEVDDVSWVETASEVAQSPMFNPGSTYISGPTKISITCPTAGAVIYYTINGTTPTTSSTKYTTPITVNSGDKLQAIAVADGYLNSMVTSVTYTIPSTYNQPETISYGSVTVDGDLSDWSSATWAPLNKVYDGVPYDIGDAFYAAKWQNGKIYVAVKVYDDAHAFAVSYGSTDGSTWGDHDHIELYIHTFGTVGGYSGSWECAQQYIVGIVAGTTDSVWTSLAGTGSVPASANLVAAGKVDGYWIYYEVAMTPFDYFGGYVNKDSIVTKLFSGEIIGLDVCALGNDGAYTGMKSENDMRDKFTVRDHIGIHNLGLIPGDANRDGAVDVGDLGILAANYGMTSNATWSLGDFNGDGKVDVGDLGILAANYGIGSKAGADFSADYAKVFGTAAIEGEETSDDSSSSICSSLGLSLVAGLALMGFMLVKLEE
jgi:LysM repeat protein